MSASDLIGWAILGGLDVLRVRATVDLPAPVLALILFSVAKLAASSGRSSNSRDRDAMLSGHNEWVIAYGRWMYVPAGALSTDR